MLHSPEALEAWGDLCKRLEEFTGGREAIEWLGWDWEALVTRPSRVSCMDVWTCRHLRVAAEGRLMFSAPRERPDEKTVEGGHVSVPCPGLRGWFSPP